MFLRSGGEQILNHRLRLGLLDWVHRQLELVLLDRALDIVGRAAAELKVSIRLVPKVLREVEWVAPREILWRHPGRVQGGEPCHMLRGDKLIEAWDLGRLAMSFHLANQPISQNGEPVV